MTQMCQIGGAYLIDSNEKAEERAMARHDPGFFIFEMQACSSALTIEQGHLKVSHATPHSPQLPPRRHIRPTCLFATTPPCSHLSQCVPIAY